MPKAENTLVTARVTPTSVCNVYQVAMLYILHIALAIGESS